MNLFFFWASSGYGLQKLGKIGSSESHAVWSVPATEVLW